MNSNHQWNGSPKPSYASLSASTSSSRSHPPSPILSSSTPTPFSFPPNTNYSFPPPPAYQSNSLNSSISGRGGAITDAFEVPPPPASTSKFHEALATKLSSNNNINSNNNNEYNNSSSNNYYQNGSNGYYNSSSSNNMSPSSPSSASSTETTFRFPSDHVSPTRERAFDVLQRELGGGGNAIFGLGLDSDGSRVPSPTFSRTGTSLSMSRNNSLGPEEPDYSGTESFDSERRRGGGGGETDYRFEQDESFDSSNSRYGSIAGIGNDSGRTERGGVGTFSTSLGHGIGRPSSMDLNQDESDSSFGFLLSPPPVILDTSTFPTTRPSTSISNSPTLSSASTKGKDRARERTFPAPLLLKGDRPFGSLSSSSPASSNGNTIPLAIGRKASNTSAMGSPVNTFNTFAPPPARSLWSSHPPSAALPSAPLTSPDNNRPLPSYKQHRYQQSSTSSLTNPSQSLSQSSITYSHSPSTSSPTIVSSSTMMNYSINNNNSGSISSLPSLVNNETTSISPQALLLYILSLRSAASSQPMSLSQSQGPLRSTNPLSSSISNASTTSNHQRIRSAGYTSDSEDPTPSHNNNSPLISGGGGVGKLDTVDLGHKKISEVPLEVIEELSDEVEKLALGYNLLRELPSQFSSLRHLRYLNIRVNLLSSFPMVLCEMPSLDILDISRNKIRRLPTNPGTLLQLKVFSMAKNRIKRLPYYMSQMTQLKVLKLDHNPLEWPPKEITTMPPSGSLSGSLIGGGDGAERRGSSKLEEVEEMSRWVSELLRWIGQNGDRRPRRPSLPLEQNSDDERSAIYEESSVGRNIGMTRTESGRLTISPSPIPAPLLNRAPRSTISPSPQGRVKGSTRMDSVTSDDQSPRQRQPLQQHVRNASHSTIRDLEPERRPGLKSKKSLPDLRQSHADILAERRTGSGTEDDNRPNRPSAATLRRLQEERSASIISNSNTIRSVLPSPTLSSSTTTNSSSRPTGMRPAPLNLSKSMNSTSTMRVPSSATRAEFETPPGKMKRGEVDRNSNGVDRNSGAYFRRLSMLPASTISKAVPVNLLEFADAIRGILFSLSQIYTALRQFVVFASQDRLPPSLARLMGSADGSMSLLINALDRFDSLSRRGTPETSIIRDIFVTCRDNVVTFGRLIAALGPQLSTLLATADVRYTRTLLLMLYGSMGEIANSWNAISPLLQEMSSLEENPSLATLILQPPTPSPINLSASTAIRPTTPGLNRARSKTRRHAGSFSVEDVQLGSAIPPAPFGTPPVSYTSDPPSSALPAVPSYTQSPSTPTSDSYSYNGGSGGTIKARPAKSSRTALPASIPLPSQPTYRDLMASNFDQPNTPGGSIFVDSPSDGVTISLGTSQVNRVDGSRMADEIFIGLVESTTRVAFDVYGSLLDSFDENVDTEKDDGAGILMRELGLRRIKELTDMCIVGNEVNTKLLGALGRVKSLDGKLSFSSAEANKLGDEAFIFVGTVIRFAKLVKAITMEHRFPTLVAEKVGSLTVATRELAKHLSHSQTSFKPSQ